MASEYHVGKSDCGSQRRTLDNFWGVRIWMPLGLVVISFYSRGYSTRHARKFGHNCNEKVNLENPASKLFLKLLKVFIGSQLKFSENTQHNYVLDLKVYSCSSVFLYRVCEL